MKELHAFANGIGPKQPTQSIQADTGQPFPTCPFSANQRTCLPLDSVDCYAKWFLWIHNHMITCLL